MKIPTLKAKKDEAFIRLKGRNRQEWLENRKDGIGGSDAASILGLSPWKTSEQLWEEKTGLVEPEDISDSPAVKYGTKAEAPLRELFALDYPKYKVFYSPNTVLVNKQYPWLRSSLDGELINAMGAMGVLEIKTTTIKSGIAKDEWQDRIPQNYFVQVLHNLLVTGYAFAVVKAQIITDYSFAIKTETRHYFFDRDDLTEDLKVLFEEEKKFWNFVESKQRPPLKLPQI